MDAILLFGSLVIFLAIGVPIAMALGCSAILTLVVQGDIPLIVVGQRIYSGNDSFVLLAVPFFMFAGSIMTHGGISARLVDFAQCVVGSIRGGLAMVATVAAMFFAAISGSSAATTAAIGGTLIPAMKTRKYPDDFSAAAIAAAGTTGIVIPPSTPMVVFGVVTGTSIGSLFLGGVIPGLLMGFAMMTTIYILASTKHKELVGLERTPMKVVLKTLATSSWALLMPFIILGGIYGGIFTPTESAAVACAYGLVVGFFIYRKVGLRHLLPIAKESLLSTAYVMFILCTAGLFGWVLVAANIPQQLAASIAALTDSPVLIMMMINLFLLFCGTFLNASAAISIVAPIFFPLVVSLGIDPVAFGVIMVVNLAIGCITPPVGVDLFVVQSVTGLSLETITKAVAPFILALIVVLIMITVFPGIIMFLPNLMK